MSIGGNATNGAIPIIADLSLTFGATLAGDFLSLILYGIGCLQTFMYYVNYPKDSPVMKLLVAFTLLLNTTLQFLSCAGIWIHLVKNFGNAASLEVQHDVIYVAVVFTGLVAAVVQSFFTWRIWRLSQKNVYPIVMAPFILAQLVIAIVSCALFMTSENPNILFEPTLRRMIDLENGMQAAVDITLCISLVILLLLGRKGFSRSTDNILARLITVTLSTGLWTAIFGLLTIILTVISPHTLAYSIVYFPIGALYFNSMMETLNVRSYVRAAPSTLGSAQPTFPSSQGRSNANHGPDTNPEIAMKDLQVAQPDSFLSLTPSQRSIFPVKAMEENQRSSIRSDVHDSDGCV